MGLYFKLIRDVQAVNTNTAELGTIWKLNLSRVIVCLLICQIGLCKNATGNLSFLRRKETIFIYFTVIIFVVYEREQNWCPRKGTSHKKQKIYIFDKFPTLHHGFFSSFFQENVDLLSEILSKSLCLHQNEWGTCLTSKGNLYQCWLF